MRYFLLIFAMLTLVGCGKKESKVIEPEGDRQTVKQSIAKKTQPIRSIIGTQTGRLIAAKLSAEIVTVAKKPSLVIKDFKGDINNVVWSPDSSKIMAGTVGVSDEQGKLSPAQVKVWDVATGKVLLTVVTPNASRNGVAWSPDGGRLAIKSGGGFSFTDGTQAPGRLRIVAAKNGDPQISIEAKSQFMKEVVSWSPDGRSLSGLIEDGVAIWEAAKGKRVQTLDYTDSEQSVRTLGWSPDGSRIAVGCDEAIVDIRNISNGKILKTFKGGFMKIGNQSIKLPSFLSLVNSVAWSPNGKLVASANNHKVTVWGIAAGTEVGAFASGTEHLAWSPDGTRLAGSTREHTTTDSITVWNVTRNAAGLRFVAHQRGVSSLAWSPDGTKLVTGGKERGGGFLEEIFTLKIWSLTQGSTQPETKATPKAEPTAKATPKGETKKPEPPKAVSEKLITNPSVERKIRGQIGKPKGELTNADLEKVTELVLNRNQLTDVTGLEKLTQLKELKLMGNELTSVQGLENLTQLKYLSLRDNQLTDVTGLEKLTHLDELHLSDNQLTDVTGLEKLTQLTELRLYDNQLTDVTGLEKLTKLRELSLENNRLTDVKGLEKLTNLDELGLYGNRLTDVTGLEKLTQLRALYLYGNKLTDVKGLEKLTQLRVLHLSGNQLTDVKGLEKLAQLRELFLGGNQLTDVKGLEKLTQLRELRLNGNQLSDVTGLEKLTQLKKLELAANPDLTKSQIDQLQKALPKCRISSNPIK